MAPSSQTSKATESINDNPASIPSNNSTIINDSMEGDGDMNTGDTSIVPQPYVSSDGNMNVQQTNDNDNEPNTRIIASSSLEAPDEPANLYRDGTDRDWHEDDMEDLQEEMKKQMEALTPKSKKSSGLSVPQPNLYREHTESPWDESDMEDLGEEMKMQIEHLKQQSGSLEQIQTNDSVYHRIMTDGDRESWSKSEATNTGSLANIFNSNGTDSNQSHLAQSNDENIDK